MITVRFMERANIV